MPDSKDPRIFFAAERTLLAWTRTSIAFMGFGFLIERFGMFVHVTLGMQHEILQRGMAFWVGLIFVLCGIVVALVSSFEYRRFVKTLKADQLPDNYGRSMGIMSNTLLVGIGIVLVFLFLTRTEPSQIPLLK